MAQRLLSPTKQTIVVEPLTPTAFAPFGTVIQNPSTAVFPSPIRSISANQGSATKYVDVSPLASSYSLSTSPSTALPRISMFSCKPRTLQQDTDSRQVFNVAILERHPYSPQTFVPMGLGLDDLETFYLVIVAPTLPSDVDASYSQLIAARPLPDEVLRLHGSSPVAMSTIMPRSPGLPDLTKIKAFVARGDQAVTYGAGTWHAPMVVTGKRTVDFAVVQYMNGVISDDVEEVELGGGAINVAIEQVTQFKAASKL